jgi:assimilatory nitrate reductase catalytic subunit
VDQYPSPQVEMHPQLAGRLGVKNGELVCVESRRGELTLPALVVKTIRPDTIFIPYHWPGDQSANRVTNRALDPISKIPEFKVCAVRVSKVERGLPKVDCGLSKAESSLSLDGRG